MTDPDLPAEMTGPEFTALQPAFERWLDVMASLPAETLLELADALRAEARTSTAGLRREWSQALATVVQQSANYKLGEMRRDGSP